MRMIAILIKEILKILFSIGNYNIYLDYSKNIYLELIEDTIDDSTQSFGNNLIV